MDIKKHFSRTDNIKYKSDNSSSCTLAICTNFELVSK